MHEMKNKKYMSLKSETKLSSSFKQSFKNGFIKNCQVNSSLQNAWNAKTALNSYKNLITTLQILSILSLDNLHIAKDTYCTCMKCEYYIKSTQEFPNYTISIVNPFLGLAYCEFLIAIVGLKIESMMLQLVRFENW